MFLAGQERRERASPQSTATIQLFNCLLQLPTDESIFAQYSLLGFFKQFECAFPTL
jgi:hypothetical protein